MSGEIPFKIEYSDNLEEIVRGLRIGLAGWQEIQEVVANSARQAYLEIGNLPKEDETAKAQENRLFETFRGDFEPGLGSPTYGVRTGRLRHEVVDDKQDTVFGFGIDVGQQRLDVEVEHGIWSRDYPFWVYGWVGSRFAGFPRHGAEDEIAQFVAFGLSSGDEALIAAVMERHLEQAAENA